MIHSKPGKLSKYSATCVFVLAFVFLTFSSAVFLSMWSPASKIPASRSNFQIFVMILRHFFTFLWIQNQLFRTSLWHFIHFFWSFLWQSRIDPIFSSKVWLLKSSKALCKTKICSVRLKSYVHSYKTLLQVFSLKM